MEWLEPYNLTIWVLGLTGLLFWIQLAVVDVVGLKTKHTPGFAIKQDHACFQFRAHRALANSNESAGILILFALFGMLSSANPQWLNGCALVYLMARTVHMLCYYFDIKLLRSVAFAIGFAGLLGMFGAGIVGGL